MNIRKALLPRAKQNLAQQPESSTSTLYYEVAERVDLVHHARSAGHANLPHESAMTPNDVETAVETEFRNRHRAALEAARGDLRSITEEFAKIEDALPTVRDLKVVPTNAAATLERTLAADESIGHARRELQERHRDERGFRRQHGLGREARYPESRVMHLALVAVLVLVESVLNLGFFAAASSLGLFGGFLMAVGVSLVNAASGVVAGFVPLRHLRNPRLALRLLAVVATVAYAVSTVMFNLAIAHYRDLAGVSANAAIAAMAAAVHHPFALSTMSVGLFILGIVVSAIAALHGYTLDDPCPGFGEVVRARRGAADDFKKANEDLRTRGLAPAESVPTVCKSVLRTAQDSVQQLRDQAVKAQRRVERYQTERAQFIHWCMVLLRRYRTENVSVRTTPPPAYFAVYPDIPSELNDDVVADLNARLVLARTALEQLAAQAHVIGMQQHERITDARRQLETFVGETVRRADHGRGDGSEAHVIDDVADESRRAS